MLAAFLIATALAAPVVCDGAIARRILDEARIDEARAPVSHPELTPGLALASTTAGPELRAALTDLCAPGGTLSLAPAERWEAADWGAYTILLTRSEPDGCAMSERSIAITVGVRSGQVQYRLRARMPATRTPVGDCADSARYRDETELDGTDGPVRLVLIRDEEDDRIVHSAIVVRVAGPDGWAEHALLDPAPARMTSDGDGPQVELTDRFEQKWVVAHGDRVGTPNACVARPGQTVWTPDDWQPHVGTDALTLLAERGLWRMAGDDGWFVIVAQDDEEDADRLYSRVQRLETRRQTDLLVVPSAWFPGLNPGFLIAITPPFPTEAEADAARHAWKPRRQAYVKRAWAAIDPCVTAPAGS